MDSTALELQPLHRGAEADLFLSSLPPWKVVVKKRVRKTYRDEKLDIMIREERTVKESAAIHQARISGVRTPSILGLDLPRSSIMMTFVDGQLARDALDKMARKLALPFLDELGRQVGYMHVNDIVHGDLTTSNIIVTADGTPCIIDFGMSTRSSESEDRGTDLHLLDRSLVTSHLIDARDSLKVIARGYRKVVGESASRSSFGKATEIARRGRYFAIR